MKTIARLLPNRSPRFRNGNESIADDLHGLESKLGFFFYQSSRSIVLLPQFLTWGTIWGIAIIMTIQNDRLLQEVVEYYVTNIATPSLER